MRPWAKSAVAVSVVAVFCGAAWGGIVNGDFSDGMFGWEAAIDVDANYPELAAAEVISEQLYVKAANEYLADGAGWSPQESQVTSVSVNQFGIAPLADVFQFDVAATIAGAPASEAYAAEAFVRVSLFYNDTLAMVGQTFHTDFAGQVRLAVPDLVEGTMWWLIIQAQSGLDQSTAEVGQDYPVVVEAWLDNFALIPEPATLTLLAVGALGLLRRRR